MKRNKGKKGGMGWDLLDIATMINRHVDQEAAALGS
jgi:hypothetical protein